MSLLVTVPYIRRQKEPMKQSDRSVTGARRGCFRNIKSDIWDFLPHDALETKTSETSTLKAY